MIGQTQDLGTALVPLDEALGYADAAPTVDELAVALLVEHRIVQAALPHMVARVSTSPDLRAAVLERLIEGECRRMLETSIHLRHQAEKRRTGGGPLGAARGADMTAWAGAVQNALLDGFKLPDGMPLGDATRPDLAKAMSAYQTQATDASIKHRWLRLVLQSVPAGKRVREALTEERVAELRAEARKADA